jgi:hypothetical protein
MGHSIAAYLLAASFAASLSAASDPFLGTWKLNMSKSTFSGYRYKIEDLGQNRYKLTFGAEPDTLTADGTDQPVHYGNTMAFTLEGPNIWKFRTKKDGRVIATFTDTLSADGKTIVSIGTANKPDGTTEDFQETWKRVGNGSGWAGIWETTKVEANAPDELVISPYHTDGLTFNTPAYKDVLSIEFDNKDYAETGPNVAPGSMSSGKRSDVNTLELTDKIQGKVMDKATYKISKDGRTLTITTYYTGQVKPQIAVLEKK